MTISKFSACIISRQTYVVNNDKVGRCRGIRIEEVDEAGNENNKSHECKENYACKISKVRKCKENCPIEAQEINN